jgi:hypothetical protein
MKLDLLTNATVVDDVIRFVTEIQGHQKKTEVKRKKIQEK